MGLQNTKRLKKCTYLFLKAVVDVNPNGVEASAATGISVVPYSAFVPDLLVVLDHPFLYFIVEKSTRVILFAGVVENPTE